MPPRQSCTPPWRHGRRHRKRKKDTKKVRALPECSGKALFCFLPLRAGSSQGYERCPLEAKILVKELRHRDFFEEGCKLSLPFHKFRAKMPGLDKKGIFHGNAASYPQSSPAHGGQGPVAAGPGKEAGKVDEKLAFLVLKIERRSICRTRSSISGMGPKALASSRSLSETRARVMCPPSDGTKTPPGRRRPQPKPVPAPAEARIFPQSGFFPYTCMP